MNIEENTVLKLSDIYKIESRVCILETDVSHLKDTQREIRDDLKAIRVDVSSGKDMIQAFIIGMESDKAGLMSRADLFKLMGWSVTVVMSALAVLKYIKVL